MIYTKFNYTFLKGLFEEIILKSIKGLTSSEHIFNLYYYIYISYIYIPNVNSTINNLAPNEFKINLNIL